MPARTFYFSSLALVALLLAAGIAWGLGSELGQSKEQLGLEYDLAVTDHHNGRVTLNLTIANQGKMAPLDTVQLTIPSDELKGYYDLVISLATEKQGGKLTARAHLSKALARRAVIRLTTHSSPDGDKQRSGREWVYFNIPVRQYIKDK